MEDNTLEDIEANSLYDTIHDQNWEHTRELLERSDSLRLVENDDDILFRAVFEEAPLDIVKSILSHIVRSSKYPHIQTIEQALHQTDFRGYTPLNLACTNNNSSMEMIDFFMEEAPKAATIPSRGGWLPLHGVIWSQNYPTHCIEKLCCIKKLLQYHPVAATASDDDGDTPMKLLFRKWTIYMEQMWEEYEFDFMSIPQDHTDHEEMKNTTKSFLLLLEASIFGSINAPSEKETGSRARMWLPLHEATKIKNIPLIFLLLLTQMMPNCICEKDNDRNNLLHLILCNIPSKQHGDPGFLGLITFILTTFPQLVVQPNGDGKLPLFLAIKHGSPWSCLQLILLTLPEIISNVDMETQLFPFMAALCHEKASINVAYRLLQFDPTLILGATLKANVNN